MNQLQASHEQMRAVDDFFQGLATEDTRLRYEEPQLEEMAA
jgi:hypothetical protein